MNHQSLPLDNAIVTPHAAFYSETAIAELQTKASRSVAQVLTGTLPATVVNSEVADRPDYRTAR